MTSTIKSLVLCSLSGLLLGMSQPFYLPVLFGAMSEYQWLLGALALVAYVPFFWTIARQSLKATFWLTLFTMTIQYTIVLYWIFIALHDYGHVASVPSALITLLLPMVLALKGGAFFTVGRFISQRFSCSFFFIAPLSLTALEYFRNFQIFGGFPWGNVGYSIGQIDEYLQVASLGGVYGLVFLVALSNALICLSLSAQSFKKRVAYGIGLAMLLGGSFAFGSWRLGEQTDNAASSIKVAVLQGDIPQDQKASTRLYGDEILAIYRDLHQQAVAAGADLIVWPESSYPKNMPEKIPNLNITEDQRAAVIGASTYGFLEKGGAYYHNSALILDYTGRVIKRYDKTHLVPFGEYVPWPLASVVDKVVPGIGAFRPGTSFTPQITALNASQSINIGTTVCYEGIFPEITRAYAREGAQLLVNITNDAWYGESSAPFQHLLMYRLRSVESGLPFVRATNSGLSAFIDTHGHVHRRLGLFERGLEIKEVTLNTRSTLYVSIGDVLPSLCLLALILAYILAVLPLRSIIRERRWGDIALIALLAIIAALAYFYYSQASFLTIEAAGTKKLFIFLLCMTILVGALSQSKKSFTILMVAFALVLSASVALAIFESPYFLAGLILAVLIFLLAMRIKKGQS